MMMWGKRYNTSKGMNTECSEIGYILLSDVPPKTDIPHWNCFHIFLKVFCTVCAWIKSRYCWHKPLHLSSIFRCWNIRIPCCLEQKLVLFWIAKSDVEKLSVLCTIEVRVWSILYNAPLHWSFKIPEHTRSLACASLAMLCNSVQEDAPSSLLVGGHCLTSRSLGLSAIRFFRTRPSAADSADTVSAHAGRSQSSRSFVRDLKGSKGEPLSSGFPEEPVLSSGGGITISTVWKR